MFQGLIDAVLAFIRQYGFVAVFVYMALETAFILHYVPSEIVVPFAAGELVRGPFTFVFFVLDTTAGATVGSAVAYLLFGRYGRELLERYGSVIHVSRDRLDWSEDVFARYGESSVLWGRMLPFVRAFISIPAGLAGMDFRRFVAYSAAGAFLFNTGLTYLVYSGSGETSPLGVAVDAARAAVSPEIAYVQHHTALVAVLVGLVAALVAFVWLARDWIRANPDTAKLLGLHVVRLVGLLVGGLFVLGALSAPGEAFRVITSVWNDPIFLVQLGFSEQVALFLVGVALGLTGLIAYEIGQIVELTRLRAIAEDAVERLRNP